MEVSELKKALHALIDEGYTQPEIALMLTKQFVRGETSKGFYIACLHLIGVTTEKMDNVEEEELRRKLYEAMKADREVGGESGKEDTAEENNK